MLHIPTPAERHFLANGGTRKSFSFTRKGPGRKHDHSGSERKYWNHNDKGERIGPKFKTFAEMDLRDRLGEWTREAANRIYGTDKPQKSWLKRIFGIK